MKIFTWISFYRCHRTIMLKPGNRPLDDKIQKFVCKFVVWMFGSHVIHHSSQVCNFSYVWHMKLKFHTPLDESCIWYTWKYCIAVCHQIFLKHLSIIWYVTPYVFLDTRYIMYWVNQKEKKMYPIIIKLEGVTFSKPYKS